MPPSGGGYERRPRAAIARSVGEWLCGVTEQGHGGGDRRRIVLGGVFLAVVPVLADSARAAPAPTVSPAHISNDCSSTHTALTVGGPGVYFDLTDYTIRSRLNRPMLCARVRRRGRQRTIRKADYRIVSSRLEFPFPETLKRPIGIVLVQEIGDCAHDRDLFSRWPVHGEPWAATGKPTVGTAPTRPARPPSCTVSPPPAGALLPAVRPR
jgi:hypothetical protein